MKKLKRILMKHPVFKQSDWQEMDDELYLVTEEKYGIDKPKGKYNHLCVKHWQFSELLEHTGVTYDSNSNIVFTVEDVWQMFYKKHKNFRAYKKNECKNYDLLGQVFNKSTVIGHLHHTSTQLPPTSDEEHQTKEEFLNRGIHVSDGEKSNDYIPGCNKLKESKFEKSDSCLEMWTSLLNARTKRDLVKTQRYKSQSNEATSVMSNPYSIEARMDMWR
ncbi:hypothetical protein P3X46_032222 [Hevea brasiliensis]|uniref:Myb/SANT-like domain-containing protein n=1 Tax=Hevea brasiliensis TaxID=3981 RepID=A0ABQ9KDN2_HEVBR|nr:hypothetical protein P3X46_032222 [Hevea brasiliensis]